MNPKIYRILWFAAFLLIEGGLFAVILIREATGPDETALRFLSVAVAAFFAAELFIMRRGKEQLLLLFAMIFTVAADVFLVLLDRHYELAVGLFLIAQCLHGVRILIGGKRKILPSVIARVSLSVLSIIALLIFKFFALLTVLGVLYAAEILMNFIDSGLSIRREKRFILSFVGFFLFILCDVTVGLNGIGRGFGIPENVLRVLSDLTWVFYLPSQVLIVLSALGRPAETAPDPEIGAEKEN